MRKLAVIAVSLLVFAPVASPDVSAHGGSWRFPSEFELPEGYFPEGIARGRGTTIFVGSLADGSVWKGDVRTGEGEVFTEAVGPFSTIGLDVDRRNRVWVAGGPQGNARVYDGRSGELLATYTFTAPSESFVNDVIVTRDAAWFTDSGTQNSPDPSMFQFAGEPRLFKVPLDRGRLPDPSAVEVLPVDIPDIAFPNLNGIETAPGRRGLVVAHTVLGSIFSVDTRSGASEEIYTGELDGADGLARRGLNLYVVENGASEVSEIRLNFFSGEGTLRDVFPVEGAETPTTGALFGRSIYVVDARFNTMSDPYKVFRVPLR